MRRLAYGLALTGLLIAPKVQAQQCASLADESVFEVQALKSKLMVHAMTCHSDDRYNAFVHRYRPDLAANEKAFSDYFKRRYGKTGQREQDNYVTQLANAQSDAGMKLGSDFCPRDTAVFDEVLSLRSSADLTEYVAGKNLIPATLGACEPVPAPAVTKAAARSSTKRAKR